MDGGGVSCVSRRAYLLDGLVVLDDQPVLLFKLAQLERWMDVTKASTDNGGRTAGWDGEGRITGARTRTRYIPCSPSAG